MAKGSLLETVGFQGTVARGHDAYWEIITRLGAAGATFTLSEIDGQSNGKREAVSDYIGRLIKAGYLVVDHTEGTGVGRRHHYRIERSSLEAPRLDRKGKAYPETGRDRMWRAMKMLGTWTWEDLCRATETETLTGVSKETAISYCAELGRVGVLQAVVPGGPNRPTVYRLLRNVGAAAPRILRAHVVFDPNSKTVLGSPEAKEVA